MAILMANRLFGEAAESALSSGIVQNQEERTSFLLGCQGPDPLAFRFRGPANLMVNDHLLSRRMRTDLVGEEFEDFRFMTSRLVKRDQRIGRAFVYGFLGHYLLSQYLTPYIEATTTELVAHGAGQLDHAKEDVRAIVETAVDTWLLWERSGYTTEQLPPWSILTSTYRVNMAVGALVSWIGWQVYRLEVPFPEYGFALQDMHDIYELVESDDVMDVAARFTGTPRDFATAAIEVQDGTYEVLAHRMLPDRAAGYMNLDHFPWTNPYTGEVSRKSVTDLFEDALAAFPALIKRYETISTALAPQITVDFRGAALKTEDDR